MGWSAEMRDSPGMTAADEAEPAHPGRSIMPPFRVLEGFLQADEVERLLAHVAAHESAFTATQVGDEAAARLDPAIRLSTNTDQLGQFRPLLRDRLRGMAQALITELKLSPFGAARVELELVAHGDGAFYRRHIDTQTATKRSHIRVLSGVYYFHRQPKRFTGGALRLYAIGDPARFADIEPTHNTLVVFPSWAPHEVRPVSCPSGRFMDSRFAVNCWLHAASPGADAAIGT
jgi:Rps23 Pro-64 3,4-dihydroxylase Tpa1-like proline 4-hydroxylase